MGKFLEIYTPSKSESEEIENPKRPITGDEIDSVIKKKKNSQQT